MKQLWGGRFRKEASQLMAEFNDSFPIDKRLYKEDIEGSLAHVKMLGMCDVIPQGEVEQIRQALQKILEEIEANQLALEGNYEDIHSFLEAKVIEKIGDVGKKMHTARSRNDQTAVTMRLFTRKIANQLIEQLEKLQEVLKTKAEENSVIMPGYTHLQRAQVITFKYHLMAYYEMFDRDIKRVKHTLELMNVNPLGSGALAGTTHQIDRTITTKELGFDRPTNNFMDAVSDRDYIIDVMHCCSVIMMHLSRLSEELILWSSQEFRFVEIDDQYSTGSSIMPQKKNPDAAELIRGKTGTVYGSFFGFLTTMKGLPLTYNKDMQEDKEAFFKTVDTTLACLEIMAEMIRTMKVNQENMRQAVKSGFLNATELADYLVKKGVPFRDAHGIVGSVVLYCEDHDKSIEELSLEELKQFSDVIENDIYDYIDYEEILNKGTKVEMK